MIKNSKSEENNNTISATGEINLGKWINESWDFVMANFTEMLIISLIYVIIVFAASSTECVKVPI